MTCIVIMLIGFVMNRKYRLKNIKDKGPGKQVDSLLIN